MDGYIGTSGAIRTQITCPEAEREVHRLRTGFDAILIGNGTLKVDNPRLTVRMAPRGRSQVRRLVLDARAELPSDAVIFDDLELNPLHIFTHEDAPEREITRLESLGGHVHSVPKSNQGLDLESILGVVQELGVQSILCEGGAKLANSLIRKDLVQRLYLFIAPKTLGSEGIPAFGDSGETLKWDDFLPAMPPQLHGRDTLIVLDRKSD
jgi:diaminohydroxyphosphoribosylaminopyrimidine deaminase/5-amino-6-(5-phosphoribosylamino)uracil reductase